MIEKVKMMSHGKPEQLESMVNEFLKNEVGKLIDIKYQIQTIGTTFVTTIHHALIVYEVHEA